MVRKMDTSKANEKISISALAAALYFVCMPFSIVPLPIGFSLLKLISAFTGGVLILAFLLGEGKDKIRLNTVHLFLALYIIYSIASLFLLYDDLSWSNLRGILETSLLLLFISFREYNEKENELLQFTWVAAGVITVIAMLAGGIELGGSERLTIDIGGGIEDPNQLCGYFLFPLLICMDKVRGKTKLKIIYLVLILAMIYVSFITGSRGGLAAVFATIGVYSLSAVKGVYNKLRFLAILLIVFSIFFTVFYPLLPESVTERMKIESMVEDRGSGRLDLWSIVYDAITQSKISLIFGHGLGSTSYFLKKAGSRSTVAHNHWLQIWCDQGFIGLVLFLAVVLAGGFRNISGNKNITISLIGMVVLSMSLTLYAWYKPFWNLLMMSAITNKGGRAIGTDNYSCNKCL